MRRLTTLAVLVSLGMFCFNPTGHAAVLQRGDRGVQVEQVQELLIARGLLEGTVDGVYGEATVEAIMKFQESMGLDADGVCGDQTFKLLTGADIDANVEPVGTTGDESSRQDDYVIKLGSRGDDVADVQNMLIAMGFMVGNADGVCGQATVDAIKSFQASVDLPADGVAGEQTLNALNEAAQLFEQGDFEPIEIIQGDEKVEPAEETPSNDRNVGTKTLSVGEYASVGSVIKPGMYGDGVVDLQKKLIAQGFLSGSADGVCGSATVNAIKNFQASVGLPADGVCGLMTYSALEDAAYNTSDTTWDDVINYEMNYRRNRSIYVDATAYSAYDPGNGSYTARGTLLRHGIIAVDPSVIPLGTRVYIPGYGEAIADDTGGAIVGNRIDIAFDSHEEAIYFGRQMLEIYILE